MLRISIVANPEMYEYKVLHMLYKKSARHLLFVFRGSHFGQVQLNEKLFNAFCHKYIRISFQVWNFYFVSTSLFLLREVDLEILNRLLNR